MLRDYVMLGLFVAAVLNDPSSWVCPQAAGLVVVPPSSVDAAVHGVVVVVFSLGIFAGAVVVVSESSWTETSRGVAAIL